MVVKSPLTNQLQKEISHALEREFQITTAVRCFGGDINQSFIISDLQDKYFLKLNARDFQPAFQCELQSLQQISYTRSIRTPQVIATGNTATQAFLLLEHLDLSSHFQGNNTLGRQLAKMHRNTSNIHGAERDNFIGLNDQPNTKTENWAEFWQFNRLGYQIFLAEKNNCPSKIIKALKSLNKNLEPFFFRYTPEPSLLHGDLWAGNTGVMQDGSPVIFDPASYYGDRETDIAMTELFGGFDQSFYTAYNEEWPLDTGYSKRKPLYQLYHVLNHFNMFGGQYGQQVHSIVKKLLSGI